MSAASDHRPRTTGNSVGILQALFTIVLVVLLLGLAGYYAWRQRQTLRSLRDGGEELSADEDRYLRGRAWRRLAGSLLMLLFAGLLTGSFFLEGRAQELAQRGAQARTEGTQPVFDDSERRFLNLYALYWIALLLGLLAILGMAGYDFWATRAYGLRHYRQLQADRRAMIAQQTALLRLERNGHP